MPESKGGLDTLQAWAKARELMRFVHEIVVPALPDHERWDLAQQIRRASKSIMANIAEGYGRYYYQEVIRFCYIARGSLEETYSHMVCAHDLGYMPDEMLSDGVALYREVQATLNGYIGYLKKTKQGGQFRGSRTNDLNIPYELDEDLP